VAVAEEAPDRDSAVAGQAEAQEDREAERARVGAGGRVRAEVYGKRARLRVVAEAEEQARAAEELEGPAAVEGEQAPVAEAARVKELAAVADLDRVGPAAVEDLDRVDPAAAEDLAADPDRVDPAAVKDLDRVDQGAVEDLAVDPDRAAADQEAVVRAAEGQEAGDPVVGDLEEEQVEVAEPEGEPGRVENRASG